jgi:hypothetical protein
VPMPSQSKGTANCASSGEIIPGQPDGAVGVRSAELPGGRRFRMRGDPGGEEHPAQHDERRNHPHIFIGKRGDGAIASYPGVKQRRDIGFVLEEADRASEVVEIPAKAAIVEIDRPEPLAMAFPLPRACFGTRAPAGSAFYRGCVKSPSDAMIQLRNRWGARQWRGS